MTGEQAVRLESTQSRRLRAARLGRRGEDKAAEYYRERGALILERNVRYNVGELDLIVQEPDGTVVFVEVKTRGGHEFGGAEAVTALKLARMRRAAARWLRYHQGVPVRFDVVELLERPGGGGFAVELFEGVEEGARG